MWSGYFTAPANGTYTFRGYAGQSFAFYINPIYGSAEPAATPLIYANSIAGKWNNFYNDDVQTAEAKINLTAGLSYYIEVYHIRYWNTYFRIAVDVPNYDQSLPFQAF